MKFAKGVVKCRIPIFIAAVILMIPALFFMLHTRVNYDMLTYLPKDMETVIGQDELKKDFGKGAFTFLIVENMTLQDVSKLKEKIEQVDHVDTVLWYDSVMDISVPMEILPQKLYEAFNAENSTMMAIFFDTGTSEDETLKAVEEIRSIAGEQCFLSGMTAMIVDLKDLCEREEPIYVAIAVVLALAVMMLFLDSWLIPVIFLASIGMMILLNLGTNFLLGQISYL
ncbi:MAG: MMPL family transporter, partial [Parasporobacterium sp.]|nr:MMPL family transporter [Parasporobacterium sp.]